MSTEFASNNSSNSNSSSATAGANSTTTSTTGNERKMPLSRSLTQPQGTIEYMVTTTDSLNSVAARFQTTPSELARMNKITGRYIFSGQILYVPKRGPDGGDGVGGGGSLSSVSNEVPPNTPNEATSRSSSNSDGGGGGSVPDSPLPGHAQRVTTTEQVLFPANHHHHHHHHHHHNQHHQHQHHQHSSNQQQHQQTSQHQAHQQLQQTVSSPISTMKSLDMGLMGVAEGAAAAEASPPAQPPEKNSQASSSMVAAIDPADRECLERFLKIAVRHITDGQGVVSGVLLVTPNALMFDPNVSDPLVIEHGTELYGVTVPMELVLKTALYTDIAHMRVKHAPEAVPSVPKPAVYYGGGGGGGGGAEEEDAGIIAEENLRGVYSSKGLTSGAVVAQFDTISGGGEAEQAAEEEEVVATETKEDKPRPPSSEQMDVTQQGEEEKEAASSAAQPLIDLSEDVPKEEAEVVVKETMDQEVEERGEEEASATTESSDLPEQARDQQPGGGGGGGTMEAEISLDLTETTNSASFDAGGSFEQTSQELSSSPQLNQQQANNNSRLSSYFQTKLALSERHSAPISDQGKRNTPPPPLVTAVSADGEATANLIDDPLGANASNINKRRSAHGESRREQMLKRLSNPVDTLGTITKSGINSSINATKTGFNATKSGLGAGFSATKSGLNATIGVTKTGLNATIGVTKTGFNKVLSTPKNLMDLSSSLVRDAKGALGTPGSKSDNDLSGKTAASVDVADSGSGLSYTNMVDTKVDAFENFDKLIPRPAKHSKDPPLYLCIRMGKRKKVLGKQGSGRGQRFSPTYSFGRKKYEREYWFSVPKEKSKNLYHFFQKWAPEVYGDVDTLTGCEARGLEPINTDDELEGEEEEEEEAEEVEEEAKKKGGEDKENDAQKLNVVNAKSKFWRRRSPLNFLKLVEDHFSTEGMSTDWNISNSSEEHSFAERFGLEPSEPILPDINGQTELLTADIIRNLSKHLPARAEGYGWSLIYSTAIHGFSLNTLYREMKRFDSPVLLIIEDTNGAIFGALLSNSLQLSDHFYGTGETFLFTFYPDFACYPWTGENLFFIKGNADSVSVGAGEGNFGLWLDGDLYHGSSHPCKTFGNQTLSSEEDFVVKSIESWGFV